MTKNPSKALERKRRKLLDGTDLEESREIWLEWFRFRGHEPIMCENFPELINMFVVDSGHHNGPGCSKCHWKACWHCERDPRDIPECKYE